jgi:colanic acid/amylovoran biosynthesis protein
MKRFYLSGHSTFSNRGCEAIVRSTVQLLREQFDDIEVFVPSSNIARDKVQWREAQTLGVRFVPAYLPSINRYWVHLQALPIPFLKRAGWPFPIPKQLRQVLSDVDCVLSVGGDNYTLDYLLPSLLMGIDGCAMDLGKPVVLWGASIGPFEKAPEFIPVIRRHLERMTFIAARESETIEYLSKLGVTSRVIRSSDPAFALIPEPVDTKAFWPKDVGRGVLGFNISPLILRYSQTTKPVGKWLDNITVFVRHAVIEEKLGVLMIPHVVPYDGTSKNNDAVFMASLLSRLDDLGNYVCMTDHHLNAAQIKYVISQCRFFVSARTHSTIAAMSCAVPTVSIAYSVKAKGINSDIFGHDRHVLNISNVNQDTLIDRLTALVQDEDDIRRTLEKKGIEMIEKAKFATSKLAEVLDNIK